MGKLKEYLEHKRAVNLCKKINKITTLWDMKIIDEPTKSYVDKHIKIEIKEYYFDKEKVVELLSLLQEESVKYGFHFFGRYDKTLEIEIKVK